MAGFEPTTFSSRSNLGGASALGGRTSYLRWRSADVRACPPLCVGVVTQLDTHRSTAPVFQSVVSAYVYGLKRAVGFRGFQL
ncbi:protein of unknown function [Streptomyces murinus]